MNTLILPEPAVAKESPHYYPAVTIVMPFEPKMSVKLKLTQSLKQVTKKVEQELLENYPYEMAVLVMQKLQAIIKDLNFSTHKNSIAIYVSPVFEKVLYLHTEVEEKVIVNNSFEIRDLVHNNKQLHKYLVLLLNEKESRIYTGNSDNLVMIVSNTTEPVYSYVNEVPATKVNLLDIPQQREIVMDKFLHRIDNSLEIILNAYPLPLFVLGSKNIVDQFKHLSNHVGAVIEFVENDSAELTFEQMVEMLNPLITDWKKVNQKKLLNQLEEAAGRKKLAVGIREVWREALNNQGRLLVLENTYRYGAENGSSDEIIFKAIEPYNKYSYIKDAVDEVIEKVLENDGEVEFVDDGVLKNYDRIALVL